MAISVGIGETLTPINPDGSTGRSVFFSASINDTLTSTNGNISDGGVVDGVFNPATNPSASGSGGGTANSTQDLSPTQPNPAISFVQSLLLDYVTFGPVSQAFTWGVAKGFKDSVIDTYNSITSVGSMIYKTGQYLWSNPSVALWVVNPVGETAALTRRIALDPNALNLFTPAMWQALLNEDFDSLKGQIDPNILAAARLVIPIAKQPINDIAQQIQNIPNVNLNDVNVKKQIASLAGQAVGMILYEVAEGLALNAAASAAKAVKFGAVMKRVKGLVTTTIDALSTASKAGNKGADAAKTASKVADAKSAVNNIIQETEEKLAKNLECATGACFTGETPIMTSGSTSKRIDEIRAGDLVLSRSETDPNGPLELKHVQEVYNRAARLLRLRVNGKDVTTTDEHPFVVAGRGWVNADQLAPGDALLTHEGAIVTIEEVEKLATVAPVYNFQVSDFHTYYVGSPAWSFDIWVHNTFTDNCPKTTNGLPLQREIAPDTNCPDWKSRRSFQEGDTGLKDHASRHSDLSPADYLAKGQLNVSQGKMLKGGGKYPDVNYWVRKTGDDQYSLTIVDKSGKILSIDTWQHGCVPMTKADILNGLKKSGVTPPQGFWESL